MWNSSSKNKSSKKSRINESVAEALFESRADEEDPTVMGMEGISKLAEQLGMDPLEDLRILVLLWKLGSAEKPAQISHQEWMTGCQTLGLDSLESFQAFLPQLDLGFLDQQEFKEFYKFCFKFNLHSTHRTLDQEMVVALLKMVLEGRVAKDRLQTFCDFCEKQSSYSRITLDQWSSFLDFCYECEDLSAYDESNSAWPVLIDEYVEYMENLEKSKKK